MELNGNQISPKMENIFMRFLRDSKGFSPETIAAHLDITVTEYTEIETGQRLITENQADQLGKLFNVKSEIILEAAEQFDLFLARNELIKLQKEKIGELKQLIHQLQSQSGHKVPALPAVKPEPGSVKR